MTPYSLFQRFGVELEFMIVDAATLDVRPISDCLLRDEEGALQDEIPRGPLSWSNELVCHVIELKTAEPARSLRGLEAKFHAGITAANRLLAAEGCRLLPTAMHPWMNPDTDTLLWPHGNQEIYQTFHRIFNCRGHGWSNLQATHLNLPFRDDDEFVRLHCAVRLLLPLLPALAASSPIHDGYVTPYLDSRLEAYRGNCARLPSLTGRVIPETVTSIRAYHEDILERIYRDLAPHDPEGILRHEWANARGAIARFERNTIEIRVLDIQECPQADLAILQFIAAILQHLTDGQWGPVTPDFAPSTHALEEVFLHTLVEGQDTPLLHDDLTRAFAAEEADVQTVGDLLWLLLERTGQPGESWPETIHTILREGALAQRILQSVGPAPSRETLHATYSRLADCLRDNTLFLP